MDFLNQFQGPVFSWVVIPLLIILARICDVSIGTVRIIMVGKGYRLLAAFLGFFEVVIWITVAGQIFKNLDNFIYYIAWGIGFATGTYIGMYIEGRLSLGQVIVRIITRNDSWELIWRLKERNYNVTTLEAEKTSGGEKIIFAVLKRQDLNSALEIIEAHDPDAFYSVEDVRMVSEGAFGGDGRPPLTSFSARTYLQKLLPVRR